ncbi:hypothetical protein F5Y04DRAFT_291415 [Hypomontagnella monticulosa]|nr:hypothetical protein F5Y04DRAFT_291415 [Hypomontagnella monticulosa]
MPKLETFEIWNGQVGSAALFSYQISDHKAGVTKAWEAVAVAYGLGKNGSPLLLEYSVNNSIRLNSHADAIKYLGLFKVLRPISLQQILTAHTARDEGLPQGLGFTAQHPTAGHPDATTTNRKSIFFGKHRAKAPGYYNRIMSQYIHLPSMSVRTPPIFTPKLTMFASHLKL